MKRQPVRSYEYKNDFLYIIIREAPEHGPKSFLFCSGVNLTRFSPLVRKSFGICSNPAFKGLQLLRADVAKYTNEKGRGAVPRGFNIERPCAAVSPHGEGWYHESLLIENVSTGFPQKLLKFSVTNLLRLILSVCFPGTVLPGYFTDPRGLQTYLESVTPEK